VTGVIAGLVVTLGSSIPLAFWNTGEVQLFDKKVPIPDSKVVQVACMILIYFVNIHVSLLQWGVILPSLSALFILFRLSKDFESYGAKTKDFDKVKNLIRQFAIMLY